VKFLRAYDVEIIRLREGKHNFSFDVGDTFFSNFEDNHMVSKGSLLVNVVLNKEVNLIEAFFEIEGSVELVCDRSLETFDYPLKTFQKMLYKYGPEEKEINEEIYAITRDTPKINLAQLLYEFILLAIPAKKIHPDYLEEMDEDDFENEGKLVYLSDEDGEAEDDSPSASRETDPRWEILKNLKKKD
jgi:uncharacterized metal-binding protein YceD (DUF177 family)